MNSTKSSLRLLGSIAALSILGLGAGASSARPIGSVLVRPATVGPHTPYQAGYDAQCRSKGGVTATPCPATVGSSNPVQDITVNAPGSPAPTISEKDTCSAKSIATLEGSGSTWVVLAGTTAGKCKAVFTAKNAAGKKVGKAVLNIKNTGL